MTIIQKPNPILIVALVASLIAILIAIFAPTSGFYRFFAAIAFVAWSGWGYDEIRYGDSIARRVFGAVALLVVFLSVWLWY